MEIVVAVGDMTATARTSTMTETGNAEDLEARNQTRLEDGLMIESRDGEARGIALHPLEVRRTRNPDRQEKALQHRAVGRAKALSRHKLPHSS
jgi:hypothetical protein